MPVGSQPTGGNRCTAVRGVGGTPPAPLEPAAPPGGPAVVGVLLLPAPDGNPLVSPVLPADFAGSHSQPDPLAEAAATPPAGPLAAKSAVRLVAVVPLLPLVAIPPGGPLAGSLPANSALLAVPFAAHLLARLVAAAEPSVVATLPANPALPLAVAASFPTLGIATTATSPTAGTNGRVERSVASCPSAVGPRRFAERGQAPTAAKTAERCLTRLRPSLTRKEAGTRAYLLVAV